MRTLSARILLGFAALTITFGVITGTVIRSFSAVDREIQLIGSGYVRLALVSKELELCQHNLSSYIQEAMLDDVAARVNLKSIRDKRDDALKRTRGIVAGLDEIGSTDALQFKVNHDRIDQLQAEVAAMAPLYARTNGMLRHADSPPREEMKTLVSQLTTAEGVIFTHATELSKALESRVNVKTKDLQDYESRVRKATIYLGLIAVILGLLITTWVVITLRPLARLRDAARRVAGGNYDSRIEEKGPSEVADLAREFNSMARAVEERERGLVRSERLAAVGKMAAMITHEVRNPLASIGLNTELLEDELGASTDEARQLCSSIHREVDRLTAITEEYLAFARLPKPKIAAEPANTLVGALAAFVREDLEDKQVNLEVDLGPGDPVALIDAGQIRQCLINLVRNAAEAVAAKGGGKVTLRTRRAAERIVISVEDDGVGIAADVLPRLFDPFFSTKEGGNGLGLALTQQIVRDHGGDLAVESTLGRGTTFTVSVPAAR